MKTINLIKVNQPIGTFYIGVLPANIVLKIAEADRRKIDRVTGETKGGVQRDESQKRIKEISQYCADPDATFPTPIIIAIDENAICTLNDNSFEFDETKVVGEILDGQHRVLGISKSQDIDKFDLPVVLMFGLTEEEKAYVFSIINSKQTRVSMSHIYDLFGVIETRSPYKVCHDLARAFNKDEASPFCRRLKMLGKGGGELTNLSQGSFVKFLMPLITKNADEDSRRIKLKKPLEIINNDDLCFRSYFINEKDEIIYKILNNVFTALSNVFPAEWVNPEGSILSKAIGYGGVMKALPKVISFGKNEKTLNKEFFDRIFDNFKHYLESNNMRLTADFFTSSEADRTKFSKCILAANNLQ